MRPGLVDRAWHLLTTALQMYRDDPGTTDWLHHQIDRFEGPLRIAVAGPARSGRSMLINALVGDEIAPVELGAAGQPFTWYQDGPIPRATLYESDGSERELPVTRLERGLRVEAPGWLAPEPELREIVVDWPARALRHAVLIDTAAADLDGTTMARVRAEADAVLYATPSVADPDLRPLRPDPASQLCPGATVDTILVLSRADEVGGSRIDALSSARLIARRRDRGVAVRGRWQTVVAVSGLLAHAARRLSEPEYAALAALADTAGRDLAEYLLSVDRFTGPRFPVPLGQQTRTALLDRLGLFGVRLATTLIRTGSASHSALSGQLLQHSGLTDLRDAISELFVNRRHLLKARSALRALRSVAQTRPHPDAERLCADIEHAMASGHELRELALLASLRSGRTRLPADQGEEARRVIGGYGSDIATRLGIREDCDHRQVWALTEQTLRRWRKESENPAFTQDQRRAARTVVRSCEGLLTELAQAYDGPGTAAPESSAAVTNGRATTHLPTRPT